MSQLRFTDQTLWAWLIDENIFFPVSLIFKFKTKILKLYLELEQRRTREQVYISLYTANEQRDRQFWSTEIFFIVKQNSCLEKLPMHFFLSNWFQEEESKQWKRPSFWTRWWLLNMNCNYSFLRKELKQQRCFAIQFNWFSDGGGTF